MPPPLQFPFAPPHVMCNNLVGAEGSVRTWETSYKNVTNGVKVADKLTDRLTSQKKKKNQCTFGIHVSDIKKTEFHLSDAWYSLVLTVVMMVVSR